MLITPPAVTAQSDTGSGQLDVNAAFMEQAQLLRQPLQQQQLPQQQPLLVVVVRSSNLTMANKISPGNEQRKKILLH